jgi:SAM-dependent methyltransferase
MNGHADVAQDWSGVASGWGERRRVIEEMKEPVTVRLLEWVDLQLGDAVYEAGAGTGELARRLAHIVGAEGTVVATDIAPSMVELIAMATADERSVVVRRADATATGEHDAAYDAVVFRMGLMLVPEPLKALHELARILRPGGRLAAATWAGPEHNPWLTSTGMALMMHGAVSGGPPVGPGGVFSLSDPAALAALAADAGLTEVTVEAVDVALTFPDVEAYLAHVASCAPMLAAALAALDDERREAVRTTVVQAMERFRSDDGLVLPGRALVLLCARAV